MPNGASESKSWAMLDNSPWLGRALGAGLWATTLGCDPNVPEVVPGAEPVERVPRPISPVVGEASRNLLQSYIERDPVVADTRRVCPEGRPACRDDETVTVPITWEQESHTWTLPYRAKRLVVGLMIAAGHDRLDSLRFLLTPDAQWGWPSTYRIGARPVFAGDDGEEFLRVLRAVAERLPERTKWVSQPAPPGVSVLLSTGAEPMWTYYVDGQNALLMHLVLYRGEARIDYVGMFETAPEEAAEMVKAYAQTHGEPPPFAARLRPPPAPPTPAE